MSTSCYLCSENKIEIKYKFKNQKNIYKCKNCGVWFVFPQPEEDELKEFYNNDYHNAWGLQNKKECNGILDMKKSSFKEKLIYLRELLDIKDQKIKILDVGCADGSCLSQAEEFGWDVYGIEISEKVGNLAKEKFGDKIFIGLVEDFLKKQNKNNENEYDLIIMNDVIEHLKNPNNIIFSLTKLLKRGGILIITTPDHNSFSSKIMKKYWVHIKLLEHLFYFDSKSIENFLKKFNFEIIKIASIKKVLTLKYMYYIFQVYKVWGITFIFKILNKILSTKNLQKKIYIATGDMTVIAKKK